MTIIAVKSGMMAADSGESTGSIMNVSATPKIIRNQQGWLAGCAGDVGPIMRFCRWFSGGMDAIKKPTLEKETMSALMLGPDGKCYQIDSDLEAYEVTTPIALGEPAARSFAIGAMLAGLPADVAVALACEHCVWVRGPVQVERL